MSFFIPLPTAQAPRRAAYPIVLLFSALALVIVLLGWGIYAQQAHRFREQENAKLTAIAEDGSQVKKTFQVYNPQP